jgi:hypothetical protein
VPGSDDIPAVLIQAGGEMLLSENHKQICSIRNKDELPDLWKEPISLTNLHKRAINQAVVIIEDVIAINFMQSFIKYPLFMVKSIDR